MIETIEIKNYKCISHEVIIGYPLTVITGLNSTGKSSLLQTVLLLNKTMTGNGAIYLSKLPSTFLIIRNRYNLFYLSANRTGTEAISAVSSEAKSGIRGEFIISVT